jgi:hypothetical protein
MKPDLRPVMIADTDFDWKSEEESEGLRTELYCATGSLNLDLDTLLSFGKDDQYNSTRDTILQLLGEFITKTKRFQLCSRCTVSDSPHKQFGLSIWLVRCL